MVCRESASAGGTQAGNLEQRVMSQQEEIRRLRCLVHQGTLSDVQQVHASRFEWALLIIVSTAGSVQGTATEDNVVGTRDQ